MNNLNIETNSSAAIVSVADGTQHIVHQAVQLPIEYGGKTISCEALVVPTIDKGLILGMNFWDAFQIKPVMCDLIEDEKVVKVKDSHDLSMSQSQELQAILRKMPFTKPGILSKTTLITHKIDTSDATPIKQRQFVVSPFIQKDIDTEIDRLLEMGVIFKCSPSAWNNPMVAVRKPSGKIRLCLDARKLNSVTVKDAYPVQQINRILGRLTGTRILSSIDFSDAFLQVPLDPQSQLKTAFSISGRGYFAYSRMPFGLCNSGATLCR